MSLRAAVIGAGHIARQHLACLRERPDVAIVGVCDLSRVVAEAAADRYQVPLWFTDAGTMLDAVRPDVVHITTPPGSHHRLAMMALEAGCHVIVEKPATTTFAELDELARRAAERGLLLVENYNYVYNQATQKVLAKIASGEFGAVTHVEVLICLDILGEGGVFVDANGRHPALALPGGAIADFVTHLASLAHAFVGPRRACRTVWAKRSASVLPVDEFRALVEAERGTAFVGFSAHSQPDAFWLRVYGEKMQAATNLFETRLTFDRVRGGAKPLRPFWNALEESRAVRFSAFSGLARKLSGGPGAYEGLWELLGRTYDSLTRKTAPPITIEDVLAVNRLVADFQSEASRFDTSGCPLRAPSFS